MLSFLKNEFRDCDLLYPRLEKLSLKNSQQDFRLAVFFFFEEKSISSRHIVYDTKESSVMPHGEISQVWYWIIIGQCTYWVHSPSGDKVQTCALVIQRQRHRRVQGSRDYVYILMQIFIILITIIYGYHYKFFGISVACFLYAQPFFTVRVINGDYYIGGS